MKAPFNRYRQILVLSWFILQYLVSFSKDRDHFIFDHLSVNDGLSQSSVYAIFQDSDGYIWFGTEDGLNRFDGTKFTVFKKDPLHSNSLSNSWIWDIDEDKYGNIWVATGNGLCKIDQARSIIHKYLPEDGNVNSLINSRTDCLLYDSEGKLWIGIWGGGLNLYRDETDDFKRYLPDDGGQNPISHNFVRILYEDNNGVIWIGTWGGGLNRYIPETDNFVYYTTSSSLTNRISGNEITAISDGPENQLWVGTYQNGISILDKKSNSFLEMNNETYREVKEKSITAIYRDNENKMWIGTQNDGLYIYDQGTFIHINQQTHGEAGIKGNYIYSIFQDKSGVVYVGNSGVSLYHKSQTKFDHIKKANPGESGITGSNVWCFAENSEGNLFIGLENNGLNIYNILTDKILDEKQSPYNSLNHCYIRTMEIDQFQNLWIGTIGEGIYKISPKSNQVQNLNKLFQDQDFHDEMRINSLLADNYKLYIGTVMGGIFVFDQVENMISKLNCVYNDSVKISSEYINTMIKDHHENLWIGAWGGGFSCLKKGSKKLSRYFHDDKNPLSLSNNIINCLHEDPSGVLWIGTNQGLNKLVKPKNDAFNSFDEEIVKYFQKDGLAHEVIYAIESDNHGNLWISTNGGLSKFDIQHEVFTNFTIEDGLQENEFNGKSSLRLSDGRLAFGGINGFNIFHPDSIKTDSIQPPMVITDISIFGEELNLDSLKATETKLQLPYSRNFISFEFAALDYIAPQKIKYAYKLEGVDLEFIHTNNRRFANYTNLDPGNYRFIVRNTNRDGIWNENQLVFDFEIMPPFWFRWWFILLSAFLVIGVIYLIFQLRLSRILEIERLRTNIANDLHDDIGSSLTKISLYSDLIKSGVNHKKSTTYLQDISSLSREVIGSMSDIVWSIDMRHDSMQDLVDRMKEFALSVCEPANISAHFHIQGIDAQRQLKPVFRQNIYLIFKEAINNILKHAHTDRIHVYFEQEGNILSLKIIDNGQGLSNVKSSLGGHGLVNIKKRASRFDGTVEFINKNGFQIHLTAKISRSSVII